MPSRSVNSPIPAASFHRDSSFGEPPEALLAQMLPFRHRTHDAREGEELLLFAAEKGLRLEERDYLREEILTVSNHEYQRRIFRASMIRLDPAAVEALHDQVKNLTSLCALTDVKLRNELPTVLRARIALDRYVERSFSVDVARDVGIQPFLLINRTRHIVTSHGQTLATACDMNE